MKKLQNQSILSESAIIFANGVCFKNPVLIGALGLYPVVAAGYSLRNGVALSIMMLIMMMPVCLISGFAGQKVPNWVRPAAVLLLSAAFYLPAYLLVEKMMPGVSSKLGICGGLMIANSIILSRANDYAPDHISFAVVADSLGCTIGFAIVICLVSALRELLSTGALWGQTITYQRVAQAIVAKPFFAFLLLGFLAALVQWINSKRDQDGKRRVTRT